MFECAEKTSFYLPGGAVDCVHIYNPRFFQNRVRVAEVGSLSAKMKDDCAGLRLGAAVEQVEPAKMEKFRVAEVVRRCEGPVSATWDTKYVPVSTTREKIQGHRTEQSTHCAVAKRDSSIRRGVRSDTQLSCTETRF